MIDFTYEHDSWSTSRYKNCADCHTRTYPLKADGVCTECFKNRREVRERTPQMKTIQLDVNVSVPVTVASDMLASRALELLRREVTRAAKRAVDDFIANGITGELEKVAVSAVQSKAK